MLCLQKNKVDLSNEFDVNDKNILLKWDQELDRNVMNVYLNCKLDEALNGFGFTAISEETVKSVMNSIKSKTVGSDQLSIDKIELLFIVRHT